MIAPPSLRDVLDRVRSEGAPVTDDEARMTTALDPAMNASQAWYVRLLVGLGAWAASAFFLAFLAVAGIVDSRTSAGVLGVVLVAVSTGLRHRTEHDGLGQLALSLCLAGRGLLYGSLAASGGETTLAAAALGLESLMIVAYPDPVNRFLSTGGAWIALLGLVASLRLPDPVFELTTVALAALTALAWEHAPALASHRRGELHGPVATAMATMLLATSVVRPWRLHHFDWHDMHPSVLISLGLTAVLAWVVSRVRHGGAAPWKAIAVTVLFGLLTSPSPAIVASSIVLTLGVHRRRRGLFGLGVAGFALGLFKLYYDLDVTLLTKSGLLVAGGALLLGARALAASAARRLAR